MIGHRTLYGATKLAAELLIEEYRASQGVPAVIDRCGVIAGPWQMGKVDQGVFTHWLLAHHFERPLTYIGFGGEGKQVRDLLHVEDLVDLVERQLLDPDAWDGATVNVGGGRECSLSLRETTEICRELTGNEVPIEPVDRDPRGRCPHLPLRLREDSSASTSGARGAAPSRCCPISISGWRRTPSGSPPLSKSNPRQGRGSEAAMPVAIITGSGGLIGSEAVGHFVGEGYDVVGIENDMRASFFGPEASTAHVTERLLAAHPEFRSESVDIRDREAVDRIFSERGERDRARHPHRRPALPRLGRERPPDRLRRQRQRHPQPARGDPRQLPRGAVHLLLDQQGLRRHPEPAAARGPREAPRAAGVPPLLQRDRHDDVDRLLDPLAVRRLEGGRRPAGPGVRPLLRDADRLLPRRLPDRAPARRRQAARLPRLPDEVHRHRDPVHRLRLRGQAGARQHPQRRPDRRLRRVPRAPRAPPPSTTSAAAASATARCSRRSRSASASPAAS